MGHPSCPAFPPDCTSMKLHPKSVRFLPQVQVPDLEGIMLMKDQNTSYQHLWFIFRGNFLFHQEHQADYIPLGLILLENCQVEPCFGATEPYAFT